VGSGVGSGVDLGVGFGVGLGVGLGVAFGVGFGVGLGFGLGAAPQPPMPPDVGVPPAPWPTRYFSFGWVPVAGNNASDSWVIRFRLGSWIEPRTS
jgi:hypothetical protein